MTCSCGTSSCDAGPGADAGSADAGVADTGADAGGGADASIPPETVAGGGLNCAVGDPGAARTSSGLAALALVGLGVVLARRSARRRH
jgi:MYXO-CTERM domain-containing protein